MDSFLVIQLARLGDLLQSVRLVRTLTRRGETHVCVDRSLATLAERVYPEAMIHAVHAHASSSDLFESVLTENWRTCAELAASPFSAVYSLNHSGMNRALTSLFAPEQLHGHACVHGQILRSRWLDLAFRGTAFRRSAPINLVDIWAGLVSDPVSPASVNPAATGGGRGLGVALSGRESRRSLPPEVLAPCIQALFERLGGVDVWLLGSEAERPLARRLRRLLSGGVLERLHDLSGKTSLADLPEALAGLDMLLSPDTGLMHLAANAGVPVQAVFLSSAWVWETGPYGLGHTVWQASAECAPCLESAPCPHGERCREAFVGGALLNALSGRKPLTGGCGLWRLQSDVDRLGLCWTAQEGDADALCDTRLAQRHLLAEYRGESSFSTIPPALTEHFYQEADWMLPDPLP